MRRALIIAVVLFAACNVERRPGTGPDSRVSQVLVMPDTVTLDPAGVWQFDAFGRTTTGDSVPVPLHWSASAGQITQTALFTADTSEDDVTVTASFSSSGVTVTGSALVRKRRIVELLLIPSQATVLPSGTRQFITLGVRTSGDTVSAPVSYSATGGTITGNGTYTAGSVPGIYRVIASRRNLADTAQITIENPPVASVTVTPGTTSLFVGGTVQLTATARDAAGNILPGRAVTWTSGTPSVASVSATGLVTAGAAGSATITATSEGQSGTAAITVMVVPVATVNVTPAAATLRVGTSAQLTATTRDASGNVLPGRTVTWTSSAPGVATVSASGLVTSVAAGSATITATSEGKSGTSSVTVTAVPVATVTVTPASSSISIGATGQLTAVTKDSAGNVLSGRPVTWSSDAPAVATVSASGLVSAVATGSATITASSEGKSGTSSITVSAVPVAAVTVAPATGLLRIGTTMQLTATARDAGGNALPGRSITWSSSAPAVATVSASGLVSAVAAGSATITATSEGKSGTSAITVTVVPVATVTVTPAASSINIGATAQLTVVTKDSAGTVLSGRTVTWSSNATGIATVSASGLVSAVAVGSATVTATSEGKSGSAAITVSGGTPPPRVGRYVAVTGTSGGDGTAARPWDLATALAGAGGRILAGDTVWVRGGRYLGAFTSTLRGASGAPIVVRAYPGERAIIDGTPSTRETFTIDGTWTVFWGLELTNTILGRFNQRPAGIYVRNTSHVKVINFIVHDVGMGTYTESAAQDVEIYGSIYYNNGNQDGTRSNGHGVYIKNQYTTPKVAADNIFFNMFGHGLHGYTDAGNGQLQNVVVEGNISFNNGTVSNYTNANILLGGDVPVVNGVVTDNMTYFSPGLGFRNLRLGLGTMSNTSIAVRRNYVIGGGQTLEANLFNSAEVSDNTTLGTQTMVAFAASTAAGWTWTNNTQYHDPNNQAWKRGSSAMTFGAWRTATGLGASDQVTATTPSTPRVFVRPNRYERGRANIAVYNWGRASSVPVDLSSVLSVGQRYEIRNVQDLFGAPVVTGTYGGGSVSLPMGGVTPPQIVGGSPVAPVRTGPDFDVFVVIPLS